MSSFSLIFAFFFLIVVIVFIGLLGYILFRIMKWQSKKMDSLVHDVVVTRVITDKKAFIKYKNIESLIEIAYNESLKKREGKTVLENGSLGHIIKDVKAAFTGLEVSSPLFHAVKLVEGDELEKKSHPELNKIIDEFKKNYSSEVFGDDLEAVVADERYIAANFSSSVKKPERS